MMWNQVRITAASFVLAGTLATGVVVGATKFAADAGDGGEPQAAGQGSKAAAAQGGAPAAKPAGSASAKPAQSISPDLQSQLSATNKTFDRMLSRERNLSIADIDRMSTWSNLMLSADLVLATSDEDRTAARTAHRDRMKKLHEAIKALPASAQNQTVNAQHAQEKLEEAESLLQSGADQGPGSGMMGMMQNQMQRMSSLGGPGGGRGGRGMMGGMMGGRGGMGGMMMGGATKKGRVVVHSASEAGGESAGGAGIGSGSRAAGSGGEFRPASEGGAASSGTGAQAGAMSQPAGGMTSMTGPGGTGGAMMSPSGGMGGPGGVGARHLSIALVTTATELAIRDKNPRSTAVRKKLDEPIPMSFNEETPLEEIVKYIKQATTTEKYQGIPIYIDPQGLQDAETTMASTVKFMELEGIPLKTTLRLLLKQLGLAYCVRDGVLIISSPQGIFAELREAQQELDTAKEIEEGADPEPSPE